MDQLLDVYLSNFYAVSNAGGNFKIPSNGVWQYGNHRFEQNKFYFITHGSCTITIEGKKYTGHAGDWFFIPARTQHKYNNNKGEIFSKYWMHFDIYPNNDIFHILKLPYSVKTTKNSHANKLFKQYVKLKESDQLLDKINVRSVLLQLIAEYINIALPDGVIINSSKKTTIDSVLRYIHHNIDSNPNVTDLANIFHLHPNHFIRFFKKETGQTPAKYINAKKMEIAKRYLEDSALSIGDIMEKIGETDLPAFSKQFKKYYSYSPREYRKLYITDFANVLQNDNNKKTAKAN